MSPRRPAGRLPSNPIGLQCETRNQIFQGMRTASSGFYNKTTVPMVSRTLLVTVARSQTMHTQARHPLKNSARLCPEKISSKHFHTCLLYTSDAADDLLCVDLGGRRIIKKKKRQKTIQR